jgi:hypothetical protein
MKLRDISEWSDTRIRTIKVMSDVCDIPLELSVRKFIPIPEDSLQKSWMDGKVKKFKETTPYAIVNMSATVKEMREYINRHVFRCMEFWLKNRDPWIQETYKFARQYMEKAVSQDEKMPASLLLTKNSPQRKHPFWRISFDYGLQYGVQPPWNTLSAMTLSICNQSTIRPIS